MALRVRSKPVLLLDPQDQLVVDLKHTIKQLRTENQARAHRSSSLHIQREPVARCARVQTIRDYGPNDTAWCGAVG